MYFNKLLGPVLSAVFFLWVTGCGSGGEVQDGKTFLYSELRSSYLWSEYVPDHVDTEAYTSESALLDALRYKPLDRFSFLMPKDRYLQQISQTDTGDGLRGRYGKDKRFEVLYVLDNSPAQKGGLRRGDIVLGAAYTDDKHIRYEFERGGKRYQTTLTLASYSFFVAHERIFEHNGRKTGYLRYDEFTSQSYDRIEKVFDRFSSEHIDDLILDLRYNGGGSVAMASILLDKIAGKEEEGEVQFALRYNEANRKKNEQGVFEADSNSLSGLGRIVVLTTADTASASELVINALRPYMQVVTIGKRTYGKPVGMEVREHRGMLYFLVNFSLVNALGEGDYYNGIPADCEVEDDLAHPLGAPEERMLSSGLYYLKEGACPSP